MQLTVQHETRIYNDSDGDYVSVGMDGDALDLVELRQSDGTKIQARITLPPEMARLLAVAMLEYLDRVHPTQA